MEEVKEINLEEFGKKLNKIAEAFKEQIRKLIEDVNDIKAVGIGLCFLVDGEIVVEQWLYSKGFNPSRYKHE